MLIYIYIKYIYEISLVNILQFWFLSFSNLIDLIVKFLPHYNLMTNIYCLSFKWIPLKKVSNAAFLILILMTQLLCILNLSLRPILSFIFLPSIDEGLLFFKRVSQKVWWWFVWHKPVKSVCLAHTSTHRGQYTFCFRLQHP